MPKTLPAIRYSGMHFASRMWVSTLALLLAADCLAQESARMEQIVQIYATNGEFSGSVLVARGDEVLLNKGYGSANLELNVANEPATKFRVGSLTKQFTAAAILLLEEQGKLRLDDTVKVHLPDLPPAWDRITIFHLLTHTSGIPDFMDFEDYDGSRRIPTTPQKLVARFRDKPLEFQPGEKWHYSNSGYVLLGYLIEQVSGRGYAQFLQENIFGPLNLQDTGYDSPAAVIPHRASGYVFTPTGMANAEYCDVTNLYAAGALYSTTGDLWRWERALFGGQLVSAKSLRKMTTPYRDNYALGLGSVTVGGHQLITHSGRLEGFSSYLSYFPDSRVSVVVLANAQGPAADTLGNLLGEVAHGVRVQLQSEKQPVPVARNLLEQFAGIYVLTPEFEITISVEDDHLVEQGTGQPRIPLLAESETRFFIKEQDVGFEFKRNDTGQITALVLRQGIHERIAPRK